MTQCRSYKKFFNNIFFLKIHSTNPFTATPLSPIVINRMSLDISATGINHYGIFISNQVFYNKITFICFRNLGSSGLLVSEVGLGCNNFEMRLDLEASRKVIHKALDLGITLFDTADIYAGMGGSETVLGTVLGDRRKDIVLATKYAKPMATDGTRQGASRRYIMDAVEASLRRLKTDYIDLYQTHWQDDATPIEERMGILMDLKKEGMIRAIGVSNATVEQMEEYRAYGQLDADQEKYSMLGLMNHQQM